MRRRDFLTFGARSVVAFSTYPFFSGIRLTAQAAPSWPDEATRFRNWADPALGAQTSASSHHSDPPWGYVPDNVFGDNPHLGWQTHSEASGAWMEIRFPEPRSVKEIWILANPIPFDILGQDAYMMINARTSIRAAPRTIQASFSNNRSYQLRLLPTDYFQILPLPMLEKTSSVRITVKEVWPNGHESETGIGKIRVFSEAHLFSFDLAMHSMYDVQNGCPVQAATLRVINPGDAIPNPHILVSQNDKSLLAAPLQPIPAHACSEQRIWIPAPYEDCEYRVRLFTATVALGSEQVVRLQRYRSYFDRGSFGILCTNHNDLGWLDTPEKTADYRASELILPALQLMRTYPEFTYSMESTAYLMEFLERHPDKRDEMAAMMQQRRFTWGASYVQLLQLSAGPEKLVRQFYFGRRWLKKTFPGVDTHFYMQTDPPSMSLQMPQLLAKAGIHYCLLGRFPFGFFNWQSPDGSSVLTRGYRYSLGPLLNPKDNSGWLQFAEERTGYYQENHLPRMFVYDYTVDYLPPQPDIVPYVRRENKRMEAFAAAWNAHFAGDQSRSIQPPKLSFSTPEEFLDKFAAEPLNLTTLRGEWPLAWAYYDEPSNREALLRGRHAHNNLLAAERLYAGLGSIQGFPDYPAHDFEEAWKCNVWPDHGWGGNHGILTDKAYSDSYTRSKTISEEILRKLDQKLAPMLPPGKITEIPVAVYNPLSWPRSDLVAFQVGLPEHWQGWVVVDSDGKPVPCEFTEVPDKKGAHDITFLARDIPSVGYRCFFVREAASSPRASELIRGDEIENEFFHIVFGPGGIRRFYDKRRKWEVLQTDKFYGGEILQFTAPGNAWEDQESVGELDVDRTANQNFRLSQVSRTSLGVTAVGEADFGSFSLRQHFHLYAELDRVDVECEILHWNGAKARELRIAFPINIPGARLSYEVPFGAVEIEKDELDVSLLPSSEDSAFSAEYYGGNHALRFREAINWIDASSPNFSSYGCLIASDSTVHVFRDETAAPVSYPVLQHVLLSDRKSLAWNPEYSYSQEGDHRYRISLLPHGGNWRERYREAIGFNYRLVAFVGRNTTNERPLPDVLSLLEISPRNLIMTAMKKSEDDDRILIRFYEAEGNSSLAQVRLSTPIRHAWKANLIEEDETALEPYVDGSLRFPVGAWEIVTLKVAV